MLTTSFRFATWFGQDDALDTLLVGIGFVLRRIETSVSTGLVGRSAEVLDMIVNGRLPLCLIGRVAGQDLPTGDDATVDLVKPDLVAELGLLAWLLAANDIRVRLKEADQFLLLQGQIRPRRHDERSGR